MTNLLNKYEDLSLAIKKLKKEQAEVQKTIVAIIKKTGENYVEGELEAYISESKAEKFRLKEALKTIDKRTLKPFITTYSSTRLYIKKVV